VLVHLTAERGHVVELHVGKGTGAARWCVDRSGDRVRITVVRSIAIVPLIAAASISVALPSGGAARAPRVSVGRGISVRLPEAWHLVQQVIGPSYSGRPTALQAGVVASFAVKFGRHPCPCARPNYRTCGQWCEETSILDYPKAGAIVFLWEFPAPRQPANLGRGLVARPARFRVAPSDPDFATALARELRDLHRRVGHACVEGPGSHPSWWSDFVDNGRVFQLEAYLGPAAGAGIRERVDAMLDSLKISPAGTR
jgi:hypothetical protein